MPLSSPRRRLLPVLALAFLLAAAPIAAPAAAQEEPGYPHVGVGAALSEQSGSRAPALLVPIDVNEVLRVEPLFGYARSYRESSVEGTENTLTRSRLRLGLGVFGRTLRGGAALYYGVRGGYARYGATREVDGEEQDGPEAENGLFAGPVIGGSYFFADYFSFGGEVEARYARSSQEEEAGRRTLEETTATFALRPSLVVRFYLF